MTQITKELLLSLGQSKTLDNIYSLNLSCKEIDEIENLEKVIKLRELDVSSNNISTIQNIDKLRELRDLDLSSNKIPEIIEIRCPFLQHLNLSFNKITKIRNLASLRKLNTLRLNFNLISKIEGLSKLTELKVLELAGNQITKIQNINELSNLEELNLSHNQFEEDFSPEEFQKFTKLEILKVANNELTDPSFLSALPNLTYLDISDNPLEKLEGFCELEKLETIHLGNCELISIKGIGKLFPILSVVYLMRNELCDTSQLSFLKDLKFLAEVDLKENPICSHPDFEKLVLEYVPELEFLNEKKLKDPGQKYLEKAQQIDKEMKEMFGEEPLPKSLPPQKKAILPSESIDHVVVDRYNRIQALQNSIAPNFTYTRIKRIKKDENVDLEESDTFDPAMEQILRREEIPTQNGVEFCNLLKTDIENIRKNFSDIVNDLRTTMKDDFVLSDQIMAEEHNQKMLEQSQTITPQKMPMSIAATSTSLLQPKIEVEIIQPKKKKEISPTKMKAPEIKQQFEEDKDLAHKKKIAVQKIAEKKIASIRPQSQKTYSGRMFPKQEPKIEKEGKPSTKTMLNAKNRPPSSGMIRKDDLIKELLSDSSQRNVSFTKQRLLDARNFYKKK